jgi:hypothetical protein
MLHLPNLIHETCHTHLMVDCRRSPAFWVRYRSLIFFAGFPLKNIVLILLRMPLLMKYARDR